MKKLIWFIVIVVIVIAAVMAFRGNKATTGGEVMAQPITVTMNAVGTSGESGTATLSDENGKLKVSVMLTGEPASASQPSHIHMGECTNPGTVKLTLPNVQNGKSEIVAETMTMKDVTDALATGPLSLNVHKSGTEPGTYVACGDITLPATP